MTVSFTPILVVDLIGSILMIVLSFLCLQMVSSLKSREPDNLIWAYLLWVCIGLAGFSLSRSAGHILKQVLILSGNPLLWRSISPYSGAINTMMFVLVGSITLFFEHVWTIHREILNDKKTLQSAKDIERRRLMDQQMAQADKLASIGEFSAGIAHEINNPLGIILGYTQLLLRDEPDPTEKHQDLKTIEKHVRNCKSIVQDLLNFARSSQHEKKPVDIHKIIADVVSFIQQHSRSDSIVIEKEFDPDIPSLVLDEKKINQVFMNLIMNARHAVGDSGTIHLTTRFAPHSDQVFILVSDTGHGIEKKNLSRIFDPFFTTKPTGEGTGLGLSVSYGIIKSHGGQIDVESKPEKGSVFTVILPAGEPRRGNMNEKNHSHRG